VRKFVIFSGVLLVALLSQSAHAFQILSDQEMENIGKGILQPQTVSTLQILSDWEMEGITGGTFEWTAGLECINTTHCAVEGWAQCTLVPDWGFYVKFEPVWHNVCGPGAPESDCSCDTEHVCAKQYMYSDPGCTLGESPTGVVAIENGCGEQFPPP
jgi:hypothetical protein